MKDTAIIIPNYNGIDYLRKCLKSFTYQTYEDYTIFVVDNGSTEPGFDELMSQYNTVRYIKRPDNGGFAVAVNDGIKKAEAEGYRYCILLNNDTEVAGDFVEHLHNAMEANPEAFSIQARMLSLQNKNILDGTGDFYTVLGYAYARGRGADSILFTTPGKIFTACAGAAIYRMDAFKQIGYFDELFWAYLEDVDIGYRARLHGYTNLYEPKAVVYHAGSGSFAEGERYSEFKVRQAARNSILVIYKNQPKWQRVINFIPQTLGRAVKQRYFRKRGFESAYTEGVAQGRTEAAKMVATTFTKEMNRQARKIELDLIISTFKMLKHYK